MLVTRPEMIAAISMQDGRMSVTAIGGDAQPRQSLSNRCRCCCRYGYSAALWSGRAALDPTLAEPRAVGRSRRSTSDSPDREDAPAWACSVPERRDRRRSGRWPPPLSAVKMMTISADLTIQSSCSRTPGSSYMPERRCSRCTSARRSTSRPPTEIDLPSDLHAALRSGDLTFRADKKYGTESRLGQSAPFSFSRRRSPACPD